MEGYTNRRGRCIIAERSSTTRVRHDSGLRPTTLHGGCPREAGGLIFRPRRCVAGMVCMLRVRSHGSKINPLNAWSSERKTRPVSRAASLASRIGLPPWEIEGAQESNVGREPPSGQSIASDLDIVNLGDWLVFQRAVTQSPQGRRCFSGAHGFDDCAPVPRPSRQGAQGSIPVRIRSTGSGPLVPDVRHATPSGPGWLYCRTARSGHLRPAAINQIRGEPVDASHHASSGGRRLSFSQPL
jgi:hypothetical protein